MNDNCFHTHLDVCQRCRENPFNLCAEGFQLLQLQVARGQAESNLREFGTATPTFEQIFAKVK